MMQSLLATEVANTAFYRMNVINHPIMAPGSGRQAIYLGNLGIAVMSGEVPCVLINGRWYTNCCPQCGFGSLCNFTCRGPVGFWVRLVPINKVAYQDSSAPVSYMMEYMPNPAITWHYGPRHPNVSSPQLSITPAQTASPGSPPFQQQPQPLMNCPTYPNPNVIYGSNTITSRSTRRGRRFAAAGPPDSPLVQQISNPRVNHSTSLRDTSAALLPVTIDTMNKSDSTNAETEPETVPGENENDMPREDSPQPGPSSGFRQQFADAERTLYHQTHPGTASVGVQVNAGRYNNNNNNNNKWAATTGSTVFKRPFCGFCFRNGESRDFYKSHDLRDPIGRLQCPVLLKYRCSICGATGQNAHTEYYCTRNAKDGTGLPATMTHQHQRTVFTDRIGYRNAAGEFVRPRRAPSSSS